MNENKHLENSTGVPWPTSDQRMPVPDTSMLPGSEQSPPAAVGMLKNAVHGAHQTIDRLAVGAEPAVRKLGDGVAAAADALNIKTGQLRETRDAWAESARTTVRNHPLASMAAALALGLVMARLARGRR